ncbi:ABC transporter substrate-binding protein [Blastococcus sp. URHD0036]|uniref:ABC transporter substrate-binding protein n=1 Tax=Blastococcus sp. URHD0036 TaxID=1380356 RepID=UPI00068A5A4B|nr:ABC transporter substrate-binding protein [Blastococcus sp. URHD0036]
MKFKALARTGAVAVALALALSACTSDGGDSDGGDSEGGNSSGGGTATLNLATGTPPADFRIGAWTGGEAYLFLSVYDTVVSLSPDGEVEPNIAETFEYNADNTELTLHIRDGMTFTDDTPVDAAAVAASLNASKEGVATSGRLASVSGVEATDESTVVVTLSAPDAGLLAALASIAGAVGSPEVLEDESSQLEPVGSGPYTLDQAGTVVGSTYTLQRNGDNWDADSYPFSTVVFQVISDTTAVQNAMLSGQIDYSGLQAGQESLYPEDQFTIGDGAPQAVAGLWLLDRAGTIVPALADVRVRQAINLALDRETIAETLGQGGVVPTNQVMDPRGDAYSEELVDEQSFDLDRAKDLMAEAGYSDGFSVTMPSIQGLTTTFESAFDQQFGEIGIDITWEPITFQDFQARIAARNYPMFFFFNGYAGTDSGDVQANTSAIFNAFDQTTPEFEQLVTTANAAPLDQQDDAFRAVNEYFVDQAWFAPLGYAQGKFVTAKDIVFTPPYITAQTLRPFAPAD